MQDYNDRYYLRESGVLYSTKQEREVPADDPEYKNWLLRGNEVGHYSKDENGNESREEFKRLLAAQGLRLYPLTWEEVKSDFFNQVQKHLDTFALTREYTGIETSTTYKNDEDPTYAAEGLAAMNLRSEMWRTAFKITNEVESGTREMPTWEEALTELPELKWPDQEGA